MNKQGLAPIAIVLIVAVVLVAGYFIFSSGGNTGTLKVQLTDAPSNLNISKMMVTLSSIEIHMATSNSGNETNPTENETSANFTTGWNTVVAGPVSYDLISLVNVTQLLGEKELEAGKYTQVRLVIESAIVTIDGEEYNLTVPSEKIKLIHPFTITAGETITLTIDFDANESVKSTGNDRYILQPTIGILTEE